MSGKRRLGHYVIIDTWVTLGRFGWKEGDITWHHLPEAAVKNE